MKKKYTFLTGEIERMPIIKDFFHQKLTDGIPHKEWMDLQQRNYDLQHPIKKHRKGGGRHLTVDWLVLNGALDRVTKLKADGHFMKRACEIACEEVIKNGQPFFKWANLAKHWRKKNK